MVSQLLLMLPLKLLMNQCGIKVNYNDMDEIKRVIIDLRDSPDLRKRMGDNGRKAYLQKYNWNAMEGRLYEVYEQLL